MFETLLVTDGRVHALAAHLARLDRSLHALYGLAVPAGLGDELTADAAALTGRHRLRVDAVPDGNAPSIARTVTGLAPDPSPGVVCSPLLTPGGLGAHKWCDRRWIDAVTRPDAVALLVDTDGCVLEAAWANLWLREGDRLVTPPADGRLLPGITRARLIELAPTLGLTVAEEPVSLHRTGTASEVFLTSSLRLAVAAVILDGPPPITVDGPPAAAVDGRAPATARTSPPSAWLTRIRAALGG